MISMTLLIRDIDFISANQLKPSFELLHLLFVWDLYLKSRK